MKEINTYTIDIKVDNYDKIDAQFKVWYAKNSSADIGIFTPTANLREEIAIYKEKMSIVCLICGVVTVIATLNILRIIIKGK